MTISIDAPAKVNLSLQVTGKRADGYHLLDSLVMFSHFGDRLDISPADKCSLEVTGPFAPSLAKEAMDANLVLRAAKLLQQEAGISAGAHIRLHKHIPVGAGLGGGSADAAAALVGLNALWKSDSDLLPLAAKLGSDVPVCLQSRTLWMRGVGEVLEDCHAQAEVWALLINPGQPLLTKDVFGKFNGEYKSQTEGTPGFSSFEELVDLLERLENSLQQPAIALMPVIGDILAALSASNGCALARMSGSGATCFGLYATQFEAEAAAQAIGEKSSWWGVVTRMGYGDSTDGQA